MRTASLFGLLFVSACAANGVVGVVDSPPEKKADDVGIVTRLRIACGEFEPTECDSIVPPDAPATHKVACYRGSDVLVAQPACQNFIGNGENAVSIVRAGCVFKMLDQTSVGLFCRQGIAF